MSIHQLNIYGMDKVDVAIERLRAFEPPEGYYLAFSGGKDSCVIKALADMAGVKYDAHYLNTGIDPPELVRFIKDWHPDVVIESPRDKDGKRVTMWSLIVKHKMPPTRTVRYCCAELKEVQGKGRMQVTGVRWAESVKRKAKRHLYEEHTNSGQVKFTTDNMDDVEMVYTCQQNRKRVCNPIIDWSDEDIWQFIKEYDVPYCKLYDEGHKRLGCIGCPMSKNARRELEQYPKYKALYLRAFNEMLKQRGDNGIKSEWQTAEDVMEWWLNKGKLTSPMQDTLLADEEAEWQ